MNEIILITGASSGIGQATAIKLAEKGYINIIIHYYKNLKGIKETESKLKNIGIKPFIVQGNIGKYNEIDFFLKEILDKYGTINIVINNAGELGPYGNLDNIDIIECENLVKVNLFGPIYIAQKVVKILKKQKKKGHILFTSSIHGNPDKGGEEKCIPYCISKSGLNNLVGIWSRDLSPEIRINAIAPGPVITSIWDEDTEETKKSFTNRTLINRWILPEEIAESFLFLIKNEAITGEILYVNGGFRP